MNGCDALSQGAGRVARVDRQGQRVPTEASVSGLGIYLPPQSFLLLQLVWNWSHVSSGKLSVFCESLFLSVQSLKGEDAKCPQHETQIFFGLFLSTL